MPKAKKDPSAMFAALGADEEQRQADERSPDVPIKRGRAKGKRSDPNFIQVGAYIPKDLNQQVKRRLFDEEMDFSDLVAELLEDWLSKKSGK